MADFSITITNAINVFGIEPTENWGSMTWGTDKWGAGTEDLPVAFQKVIDNAEIADTTMVISNSAFSQVENSVSFQSETTAEYLSDGSGYFYMFGNVTNADSRSITTWSQLDYDTATFVSASRPTTVWV